MKFWSILLISALLATSVTPSAAANSASGTATVDYVTDTAVDCGPTRGVLQFEIREDRSAVILFVPSLVPQPVEHIPGCPDAPDFWELPPGTCGYDSDAWQWDCVLDGIIGSIRFTVYESSAGPSFVVFDRQGFVSPTASTQAWGPVLTVVE